VTGQAISNGERPPYMCWMCDGELELVTGARVYPHRPERAENKYWLCVPCKAWIIAHAETEFPLGTPAKAPLRAFRMEVYDALKPLVERKIAREEIGVGMAWKAGSDWLAGKLGLESLGAILINTLTEVECREALAILKPYQKGGKP
jgi:hypothetical protein